MNRKIAPWLRVLAVWLALGFVSEGAGAAAAIVVAVSGHASCCAQAARPDDCAAPVCPLLCGVTCCALMQESEVPFDFAASRECWAIADESGAMRPAKPPVPPPRV